MNRLEQHLEWWITCGVKNYEKRNKELIKYKKEIEDIEITDAIQWRLRGIMSYQRESERWLLWVLEMSLDYHLQSNNNPFQPYLDFKPWFCTCIPEDGKCTCPEWCGKCKERSRRNLLYSDEKYRYLCKKCNDEVKNEQML